MRLSMAGFLRLLLAASTIAYSIPFEVRVSAQEQGAPSDVEKFQTFIIGIPAERIVDIPALAPLRQLCQENRLKEPVYAEAARPMIEYLGTVRRDWTVADFIEAYNFGADYADDQVRRFQASGFEGAADGLPERYAALADVYYGIDGRLELQRRVRLALEEAGRAFRDDKSASVQSAPSVTGSYGKNRGNLLAAATSVIRRVPAKYAAPSLFMASFATTWSIGGPQYAVGLMGILLIHEMGHYVIGRLRGIRVSLPYFIPFPWGFGTFGAIIRMKSRIPDRNSLFDMAVSGPIAGFLASIPIAIWGIRGSSFVPSHAGGLQVGGLHLGSSILLTALIHWARGPIPPGYALDLSPLAVAGWVGFYATMLNLLPFWQMDGGHISFAVFGRKYDRLATLATIAAVTLIGFAAGSLPWLVVAVSMALLGSRSGFLHPPTRDDRISLTPGRKALAALAWLLMILLFVLKPFS